MGDAGRRREMPSMWYIIQFLVGRDQMICPELNRRITLLKYDVRLGITWNLHRIMPHCGFCEHGNEPSGFINTRVFLTS